MYYMLFLFTKYDSIDLIEELQRMCTEFVNKSDAEKLLSIKNDYLSDDPSAYTSNSEIMELRGTIKQRMKNYFEKLV